ncbi:DUF58 domain-containing protein [Maricurvus nonylphenolicus]|uniref:DUF58 domain-containing protein n=1 Tax=Maricurvus nonylphenolicus TaxID=1008307 RepID=UPI0036F2FC61
MAVTDRISDFYRQRFWRWVSRRLQPQRKVTLDNKKLFIFPSKAGFGFLGFAALLWLVGTNYENNLILGLAFTLTALFVVTILHTFSNLSGLQLEFVSSSSVFLGDDGEVELLLQRPMQKGGKSQGYENILVGFPTGGQTITDLIEDDQVRIKAFVPTCQRGWFNPGRLLVESRFPFGIIRCWTWLDMDMQILVYPQPLAAGKPPPSEVSGDEGEFHCEHGAEDFYGFKSYQPGESLKQIAWKQYARGGDLYTKEYATHRDQHLWLDWDSLEGMGREERLSRLCFWVLEISKTQQEYGLRLPGVEIVPGTGLPHKQAVLKALALFECQHAPMIKVARP